MNKKYFSAAAKKKARKKSNRAWSVKHPDRKRAHDLKRRHNTKDRVFRLLGDKCANPACQWLNADGSRGCTDRRCLQIDHVEGDGPEDKKLGLFSDRLYRFILKIGGSARYQLLCANCNWIKRHVNREHR